MRDPFRVLGLSRDAGAADVKRAYRQLVKKYHPDATGGDAAARARFQEISDAYRAALSACAPEPADDRIEPGPAEAARAYERDGEAGARPRRTPPPPPRPGAGPSQAAGTGAGTGAGTAAKPAARDGAKADAGGESRARGAGDFLDTLKRAGIKPFRRRGDDIACTLTLPFLDAARGGSHRVTLPTGRTLDIGIPAGIEDGRQIRLRGQGEKGAAGGSAGDALITVEIEPHPYFSRDGDDIRLVLPVSIAEAIEGAKIQVPTVSGRVWMTVPAGSNTGTVLRLQGRGLAGADGSRGHQYVELVVVLPEGRDQDLAAFVRDWPAARSHDPRAAFGLA